MINQPRLTRFLREHFRLDWYGIHGVRHWARVRQYARAMAAGTEVSLDTVTLFALLHDCCRVDDGHDPCHGPLAAALVRDLNGTLYHLCALEEDRLMAAIDGHSEGRLSADLTVQICWDADRLDLGRFGMIVRPEKLGTDVALAMLANPWPYRESVKKVMDFKVGR